MIRGYLTQWIAFLLFFYRTSVEILQGCVEFLFSSYNQDEKMFQFFCVQDRSEKIKDFLQENGVDLITDHSIIEIDFINDIAGVNVTLNNKKELSFCFYFKYDADMEHWECWYVDNGSIDF